MRRIAVLSLLLGLLSGSPSFCASRRDGPKPLAQCSYMVVVPETHITHRVPDPAGETEVIRQLTSHGLRIVDGDRQAAADIRYGRLMKLANEDAKEAAKIGRRYGADIIIVGEAFSELAGRNSAGITCRSRFEARAVRTADGSIVFADNKAGSGLDIAELIAAKTAVQSAAAEWSKGCLSVILKGASEGPRKKRTLAILGFWGAANYERRLPDAIANAATNTVMKDGHYELVERGRIQDLVGEQTLAMQGITDSQGAKLGGMARADIILIGHVAEFGQHTTGVNQFGVVKANVVLEGRLVDVRRGTVLASTVGKATSIKAFARESNLASLIDAGRFGDSALGDATAKAVADLLTKLGYPCASCGDMIRGSAKFCPHCGTPTPPPPAAGHDTAVCSGCGKAIPAGSRYCPQCGHKL